MRIIGNNPNTPSQLRAIASGTLANGDPVVINSDGTVSVGVETIPQTFGSATVFNSRSNYNTAAFDSNSNKVVIAYRDDDNANRGTAIVGTVSGTSISFGSEVVFSTGTTNWIDITFDSNANKVVIAYQDASNSSYGKAIVGTVSGTSISFGTAVVFESAYTHYIATTFDSNLNKVVIAYSDFGNSGYGTAIVGTVSGTSISFGTPVVYESASSYYTSAIFDSNANKVVIAYRDAGNSFYGTAIVGTVSGTSISFGSAVVFENSHSYLISATFDSNLNKVVIAYVDNGNSNYGTAIVGTVSGTSISFGTAVIFNNASTSTTGMGFDPNVNKVVIAYRDASNSNYGTAIVGTVSGTSISFGSDEVFDGASYLQGNNTIVFDSNSNRIVIAYKDNDNSEAGTAIVFKNAVTNVNYTSENYIGIARSGATSGAGVIVDTQGAIADNLSGLTAGQSYFLADDGSLSETNNGRKIGTAVSATKLLIDTAMSGPETDAYLGGLV